MAEILKLETATETGLLAQLAEIEEWSDFAAEVLIIARRQPNNLGLRDQIAKLAEKEFEKGGNQAVLNIYARAIKEVGAEAEAAVQLRLLAISLDLDPNAPGWYIRRMAEAAEKRTEAKSRVEVLKAAAQRLLSESKPQVDEEAAEEPEVEAADEPATEPATPPHVAFADDQPIEAHDYDPVELTQTASYDNAREYARRHCWRNGALALYYWRSEFWEWDGWVYRVLPEADLKARIYEFLDASRRREGKDHHLVRFRPRPAAVRELIDGLGAGVALPDECEPPMLISQGSHMGDALMFANALLNSRTGESMSPTPDLWIHQGIRYDFDPKARCPQWLTFLESVLPGDTDAQKSVEELLGLSMTEDVSFQKGAMLASVKPRCGKGTIIRVGEGLSGSYVSMDFDEWNKDKACEPMVGKKMIAFPDVRLKEPKMYGQNFDPGGLDYRSVQRTLKITAADPITISRKYIAAFEGVLPGKVWIASNKVLNFNDAVLPTRFIKLAFDVSFLNREDIYLSNKLLTELPGIANRCLAAYHAALDRGRLIQPASGARLGARVSQTSDAFAQFINDNYVFDKEATETTFGDIYAKLTAWCKAKGRTEILASVIPQNLKSKIRDIPGFEAVEGTSKTRKNPARRLLRIRLRTKDERAELREAAFDEDE
jgi:putative DNA primase/helicase